MKIVFERSRFFGAVAAICLLLEGIFLPSAIAEFREPTPWVACYLYKSVPTDDGSTGQVGVIRLNTSDRKTVEYLEFYRYMIDYPSRNGRKVPLSEVRLEKLEALWGKPTTKSEKQLTFKLFGYDGKVYFVDLKIENSEPHSFLIRGEGIEQADWILWR